MKVVPLALLYLGSVSFFGVDAANLDIASDFKRKWNRWALRRARRDLTFPAAAALTAGQVADANLQRFVRAQDVKDDMARPSRPQDTHLRVKRYYRQNSNGFPPLHMVRMSVGCRFGTCTVQNLAHQISQLTDKDKDGTAPRNKLSPQGYGRRRRRRSLAGDHHDGGRTRLLARLLAAAASARRP
uniref:Pro-adrenomedullin n=1 Tax=Salvator merianae TaxID=96440 RepID=A0A8D0CFM5_SALMN